MSNYPMNIWVITENEFDSFTFTGGKVIYIVEEPDVRFATHPAIVTAGTLLPPMEAIEAELDGDIQKSIMLYEDYLRQWESNVYISIILAAAIKQVPIGIMFGRDESNMQFPKMLIDFLYKYYGLVLGIGGKIQPYIVEQMIPKDLSILYASNMIDYQTFMEKHPPFLPIDAEIIPRLAYDIRPAVSSKDMNHYIEYFEKVKETIYNNGGKFIIDPFIES